jgi:hypothetical protein
LNADADSYFAIVAAENSNYNNVLAGIKETFTKEKLTIKKEGETREEGDGSIVELKVSFYKQKPGKRTKITATRGTTNLVTSWDDVSDCSVQAQ